MANGGGSADADRRARGGDPVMAHIAMMQALHRDKPKGQVKAESTPRRKRAKVYKIVR
jgi:hypothetical protein